MNADTRESITRATLSMRDAGEPMTSIVDRLRWSPLTRADERDEVETIVRDVLAVGFTVRGVDAEGNDAQYPAPDDVLRDTSQVGWPVIRDAREALTDARCACIEAQGWTHAEVYRVEADGAEILVGSVGTKPPAELEPERRIYLPVAEVEARVRAAVNPHGHAKDPYGHLVPLIMRELER